MEKEFKKVEETLNRLQALHKDHIESFDQEVLPDLSQQSEIREIEVGMLVKNVKKLIVLAENQTGEGVNTKSMILRLNDRVTTLLEQNKTLETKVSSFRDQLKNSMNQVSKGKKAISSYRSSTAVSNNPKVISITHY
jgi:predicted  nucleic acid-binding Zn-ribbon protein